MNTKSSLLPNNLTVSPKIIRKGLIIERVNTRIQFDLKEYGAQQYSR